jgi:hypothetical protein
LGAMATNYPVVSIKLRPIDEATLKALEDVELLSRSDICRRALRHYAKALGIEVPTPKRPKTKPTNQ